MRVLIVVPTYDEAENLLALAAAIFAEHPDAHLLVVDDASPDGTGRLADELAARDRRVAVRHRPEKSGLGGAYREAFAWGLARRYDAIVQMDADFSHDPRHLARLLGTLADGADLAIGSRGVPGGAIVGWGPLRHVLSKGGSAYARLVLDLEQRDLTSGFKAWTRRALAAIDPGSIRSNGYAFQIETTARAVAAGLDVREVPIVFRDRRVGRSKMDLRVVIEAVGIVRNRRLRPAVR